MSTPTLNPPAEAAPAGRYTVLELTVHNHTGIMAQVSGLCARRAFHVEGFLYLPLGRGAEGRIWLRLPEDQRIAQVIKQIQKLEDVLDVRRHAATNEIAGQVAAFFQT
jgi:acetolactate synthase-1/3 small subunit